MLPEEVAFTQPAVWGLMYGCCYERHRHRPRWPSQPPPGWRQDLTAALKPSCVQGRLQQLHPLMWWPGPVWYEPDRLSSKILLEGVLRTKGKAKCCPQGLWCITAHIATYSNLHLLEQRECKKSWKEKLCFQQNLSFLRVFQRVMQDTYCNCVCFMERSIKSAHRGCLHRETKGCYSPAHVRKGQSLRVKKYCRYVISQVI